MKVKATNKFKLNGVRPKELENIPEAGTEFEISDQRYEELKGYVEKVEENPETNPDVNPEGKKEENPESNSNLKPKGKNNK